MARPHKAEIEARILENAPRYFPALGAGDVDVRCESFRETSSYPLVRCGLFDRATSRRRAGVVVKFPPVWSDSNEAQTEFRQLERMARVVGTGAGHLRVPRPLDYFPDWSALVTEEVAGERFSRRLLADASRFAGAAVRATLAGRVHACGQWLAAFHGATAGPPTAPFDTPYGAAVRERLERLATHGLPRTTVERVLATLDDLRAWGAGRRVAVAGLHGDFGPQNVHVGDGWVCVFDLSYDRQTVVYDDVCYFLVTLETTSPWPRYPLFDRAQALALQAPFLEGYFGRAPLGDEPALLAGHYLKALVFRCAKQRRNVSARGRAFAWTFDRTFLSHRYPRRLERQCRLVTDLIRT